MRKPVKVLLVYPNIWSDIFPLSILTLAAVLKQAGVEVRVFSAEHRRRVNHPPATLPDEGPDEAVFQQFADTLASEQPDVIAFSVVEDAFPLASRLLDTIEDFTGVVILGGVFATFAPRRCIQHPRVDAVCVGEGERALTTLCERLGERQAVRDIPGLWLRLAHDRIQKNAPGPPVDLDRLPTPDYALLDRDKFSGAVPVIAHRGCPYACTFCNSPAQARLMRDNHGCSYFRKQGMATLARDLQALTTRYASRLNHHGLYFCSDTFLAWSSREFDAFIELYSDYRIPFVCHSTPETISANRMEKLVSVGLKLMNVGVQHGNEQFRRDVLQRGLSNREITKRFAIAADSGAMTSADFIMGLPLETPQLARDTIVFSRNIRATVRMCSLFVPYHGTALRQLAIEHHFLPVDELAVWSPAQSQLDMPDFPRQEISRPLQAFHARPLRPAGIDPG